MEREDLKFDFSSNEKPDYSPQAQVTASYRMKNPTQNGLTVQMAFPLISSIDDLSVAPKITLDGKSVSYRLLSGPKAAEGQTSKDYYNEDGTLNTGKLPSFEQILKIVQAESGVPETLKGSGKLYRISTPGQKCKVYVTFNLRTIATTVITSGFNGFQSESGSLKLDGYTDGVNPIFMLIVGKDITGMNITYTDLDSNKKLSDSIGKVVTAQQNIGEFLQTSFVDGRQSLGSLSPEFRQSILSALESHVAELMAGGQTVISEAQVYDFFNQSRFFVLAYEVPFSANSASEVTVSYPMSGTMDASIASNPVYRYGYLLNPAKGWADFKNLNITVIPPREAPYVVKSSLPLSDMHNGSYSAELNTLPDRDLIFTLYSKSQIAPDDKPQPHTYRDPMLMILAVFGLIAAVIVVLKLFFLFYHKLNKKGDS